MAFAVGVSVRLEVDERSVSQLKTDPAIADYIQRGAEGLAQQLRDATPRASGAGAASIATHPGPASMGAFDSGWDKAHYYLGFPEYGTKYQSPQAFAWLVLQHYTYD